MRFEDIEIPQVYVTLAYGKEIRVVAVNKKGAGEDAFWTSAKGAVVKVRPCDQPVGVRKYLVRRASQLKTADSNVSDEIQPLGYMQGRGAT